MSTKLTPKDIAVNAISQIKSNAKWHEALEEEASKDLNAWIALYEDIFFVEMKKISKLVDNRWIEEEIKKLKTPALPTVIKSLIMKYSTSIYLLNNEEFNDILRKME